LLFSFVTVFVLLLVLNLGAILSVVASIPISIALTLIYGRGIANDIFSDVMRAADAAAARRMDGRVLESTDGPASFSLWWLDFKLTFGWSPEELWTRNMIFAIASVLFLVPFPFEFRMLQALGMGENASALTLVLAILPLSLYLSRRFCVWMWPEYVKRADTLAHERESKTESQ
jgi:hypothetical protein